MMSLGLRTEFKNLISTLADTSHNQRDIDISGVIPLPPVKNKIFLGILPGTRQNLPLGPAMLILSPTFRLSGNQFETKPPGTRFTVTSKT
ncbi:hypothetical protein THIOM_001914 [Candidatus Thiomargarita nelsonii]|uniref:Uncharacterized protein n=1 Tax=Candidatus Thiomargarita nelsonii TaxID=1003181 RepID=A0A176S2Z3_9GAMM|nr:hypothetical protein THIOM_001914 [Candidatus Thiomargarita nelsonii]